MRRRALSMRFTAVLLLGILASGMRAQVVGEEAAMVAWIERQTGDVETLVERLVDINSGTMNYAGVREVGAILDDELTELGFETEWVELPAEVERAGHLFARHSGDRGKRVLLIGHLDTVFEQDDAFQEFVRHGSWASGPGSVDMKSGNVVIIFALKALAQIGALDGSQIVVAYTGDEESVGAPLEVSRRDLVEAGQWADVALGFEYGVRDQEAEWATIARRSSSEWRLEVSGQQAHSSLVFSAEVGAGAIFEASRILTEFYETVRGEEYLTFNAGAFLGGTDVQYDFENTRRRSTLPEEAQQTSPSSRRIRTRSRDSERMERAIIPPMKGSTSILCRLLLNGRLY